MSSHLFFTRILQHRNCLPHTLYLKEESRLHRGRHSTNGRTRISLSTAHAVFPAPRSLVGWHVCLCLSLRLGCTPFEGKNLAWLIFPCLEWFSPKFLHGFLHQHFLQFSAQMSPYQSDFHWPPYINSSYTTNHELYIFTLLHLFCSAYHHLTHYIFVSSFMLSPLYSPGSTWAGPFSVLGTGLPPRCCRCLIHVCWKNGLLNIVIKTTFLPTLLCWKNQMTLPAL